MRTEEKVLEHIWQALLLGLALSTLIGCLAYKLQALDGGGVAGAVLVGTALFGFGGMPGGAILLLFFLSSSMLSSFQAARKASLVAKFVKGHRRDLAQALANGGVAAIAAALYALTEISWAWAAIVGAVAAANADTWATELGVLSSIPPRLITTGGTVPVGSSGGITPTGLFAALAGAASIAGLAIWLHPDSAPALLLAVGTIGGFAGAMLDSLLGASLQAIYWCEACSQETEYHPHHRCGQPTRQLRGWVGLQNDWVNFFATLVGAVVAAGTFSMLA